MTEEEWLTAGSVRMIGPLRGASDRKLRLVGCALSRTIWSDLSALGKQSVEIAEAFADGQADRKALAAYFARLRSDVNPASSRLEIWLPSCAISECGWYAAELAVGCGVESSTEIAIIRDIFGNPFRPITVDPSWLTSTVVALAEGIYADRAFDRLPILADALQDAGCDNADILAHCRADGPHVRGCWVVDLVLGKT